MNVQQIRVTEMAFGDRLTVTAVLFSYQAGRTERHVAIQVTYNHDLKLLGSMRFKHQVREDGTRNWSEGNFIELPDTSSWNMTDKSTKQLDNQCGPEGIGALVTCGLTIEQVSKDLDVLKDSKAFKKQLRQRTKYARTKVQTILRRIEGFEQLAD